MCLLAAANKVEVVYLLVAGRKVKIVYFLLAAIRTYDSVLACISSRQGVQDIVLISRSYSNLR